MKRLLLLAAAAFGAAALAPAASAESPAEHGQGARLTKFEAGTLRAVVAGPGAGDKSTSYLLDYTITNESGAARKPALRLEVRTKDTKRTHGDFYDAAAFKAFARETRTAEPASTAKLRSSDLDAGAKASGLADFGTIDPYSDSFQVRVYGLYDPVFRDKLGKTWWENRVLVLNYERTGDEYDRYRDPIRLASTVVELEGEPKAVHPAK
jgi:hypothetical protein